MSKKEKDNIIKIIGNITFPLIIAITFLVVIPFSKSSYIPLFTGSNSYIDMKSIYKEFHKDSTTHSFWTKHIYKDHYELAELNIDCLNRSIVGKTHLKYKNNGERFYQWKNNNFLINRDSIVPNTNGMKYYRVVCQPHVRYIYTLESAYPNLQGKFNLIENRID